jgi:hypothetical protein
MISFLLAITLAPGHLPHAAALAKVDAAWRRDVQVYIQIKRLPPYGKVVNAVAMAIRPNATRTVVYKAILMNHASQMFGIRDADPAGRLEKKWQATETGNTYEAQKASLLSETSGWGRKEYVAISHQILESDPSDEQGCFRAATNLMGYGTKKDNDLAYRHLTGLRDRLPRVRAVRSALALCAIGQGNRNPDQKAKYFAHATREFKAFLSLAPAGHSFTTTAHQMLRQLEEAQRTLRSQR